MQVIVDLKANQTGPVMLLDQISRLMVDGVWLTRLELDEGSVIINGSADVGDCNVADFVDESRGFRVLRRRAAEVASATAGTLSNFYGSRFDFRADDGGGHVPETPAGGGGGY